jgi:acyl-CoA reductase-like NAD-dependent aldehyde dehydrogenase
MKQISLSQVASKNVTSFRLFSSRASLSVDNPYTGEKYCEMPVDTSKEAHKKLDAAVKAQKQWKQVSLSERHKLCTKWIDILMSQADNIAKDITGQMGKPLQQVRSVHSLISI